MWEARFDRPDYVYGRAPVTALPDHAGLFTPDLKVLSIAEGEGRNAVWMAQQGCKVTALEQAPSALRKARDLAREAGVHIDFRSADVLKDPFPGGMDMVAGIFIQFVGPAQRRAVFAKMANAVRPGGKIFLHGFTPDQVDLGTGGPSRRDHMYTEGALRVAFKGWPVVSTRSYHRVLNSGPAHHGEAALIDFIAEKPV